MNKSINKIAQDVMDSGEARTAEEFENLFDFAASEAGYTDEEIEAEKASPWFPNFK